MLHNTCDQCNALVTQFATADGTVREERAHELLDTELAREVLAAIVGGRRPESGGKIAVQFRPEWIQFHQGSGKLDHP
jgi:hypothetical protein